MLSNINLYLYISNYIKIYFKKGVGINRMEKVLGEVVRIWLSVHVLWCVVVTELCLNSSSGTLGRAVNDKKWMWNFLCNFKASKQRILIFSMDH